MISSSERSFVHQRQKQGRRRPLLGSKKAVWLLISWSYIASLLFEVQPSLTRLSYDLSGRLRHGSTISHTAAIYTHEYHLHLINAHARDLFPYVLYCAMSQRVATKLVIDLWNRRWSFLTVWSNSSEHSIPLLHRFFWKLIWSRIGEW